MTTRQSFLILLLLFGLWIAWPQLNYMDVLAQGDHGRDLYSIQLTSEGKLPYRDFQTHNGPLMFFYYDLFFKLFGVSIQSVLFGQHLLIILIGIVIYLIGIQFMPPVLSFNAALWYWVFRGKEFYYTFNHHGAALMMALVLLCLAHYIKSPQIRFT